MGITLGSMSVILEYVPTVFYELLTRATQNGWRVLAFKQMRAHSVYTFMAAHEVRTYAKYFNFLSNFFQISKFPRLRL